MSEYWGPGVTRTLSALARNFTSVVWQDGKPPLDSELNLVEQIQWESLSDTVRSQVHSGFFIDPTRCESDYTTYPLWTNQFVLAPVSVVGGTAEAEPVLLACVNGWVFPVAGTDTLSGPVPDDVSNRILLNPPPTTDNRTDFVFLEVWRALVSGTPSTVNKPSAGTLWKYGNVQYGGTNPVDDIIDPSLPIETTKRIQLQYRIRVVGSGDSLGTSVDLTSYPDGLTDPQVRGQGTSGTVTSFGFTNMRQELGDPSLWRAGNGDPTNALGTVDGYVYAIPIASVSRRNSGEFVAVSFSGNPNQNGAVDRTPSSHTLPNPRDGARSLTQAALAAPLGQGVVGDVVLTGLVGSGLEDSLLFPSPGTLRFLVVGEGVNAELIAINGVSTGPSTISIDASGRGRGGSGSNSSDANAGRRHPAGTPVRLYNSNPLGFYSDQIAPQDIQDMRRSVTFGEWDYNRLLQHSLAQVIQNNLRTSAKTAGTGGNTRGVVTTEVSYLHSPLASPVTPPNAVDPVDGPDGIRTVWSDAATIQRDTSVILDPAAPMVAGTVDSFDTNLSLNWSVSADWQPHGFLNTLGASTGWTNGSVIFFHIGGVDGTSGARYGIQAGQRAVRFLAPYEAWLPGADNTHGDQHPWKLRFLGGGSGNTTTPNNAANNGYIAGRMTTPQAPGEALEDHPGPMYPIPETNFERPFIVLGDILNPAFIFSVTANSDNLIPPGSFPLCQINIPGQNWDTINQSSFLLGRSQKQLRDMLTLNGQDTTGFSSQIYILVYGDDGSRDNNGAFKVVGAGTVAAQGNEPYTQWYADDPSGLVVIPLSADFSGNFDFTDASLTLEFRSQEINADDDNGKTNPAGVAVVFTDLQGRNPAGIYQNPQPLPWYQTTPRLAMDGGSPSRLIPVASKAVMDTDILWSPSHGASTRVPDRIVRFSSLNGDGTMLRSVPSSVDPVFSSEAPFPDGERVFESTQIQLWNRLPSRGWFQAGNSLDSDMWGGRVVGSTEQDREAELFVDLGSKTAVFRPFQLKNMTLKGFTTSASPSLVGATTYSAGPPMGSSVDGAGIFSTGMTLGYPVPVEFMPRFGRQDIPYHISTGALDPLLPGVNHLFSDQSAIGNVFAVIGGENNTTSGNLVLPMLFSTSNVGIPYGTRGTLGGALHPAYGARRQFYGDVISSDLGVGMHGIELPPYHGVARVYGVYEYNDFMGHLSGTYPGAFQADRLTPIVSPPKNLLKVGATKQTLFIRQGGGSDVTGSEDSHTYLIPESALDISNIPGFTSGQTFTNYHYVVECEVFGFARGFINQNNFVLARRKTGAGVTVGSGSNLELTQVGMMIPTPASKGDTLYETYERTVYQGDPYLTRDGSVIQTSDYEARYGQIPQSDAFGMSTRIQQFNATTGVMTVTRPNPRALEVLASVDFYTTIGTGKMGGKMWPGSVTDCGYVGFNQSKIPRLPEETGSDPWRIVPRAFTAGQLDNSRYATLELVIKSFADANTYHLTVDILASGDGATFTANVASGDTNFTGTSNVLMAQSLATKVNEKLSRYVTAVASNGVVLFTATVPGSIGNTYRIRTRIRPNITPAASGFYAQDITSIAQLYQNGETPVTTPPSAQGAAITGTYFTGGIDLPVNAGDGSSMVGLTGMTERLPLGILVSDSDFIAENILSDNATALATKPGSLRAVYQSLPLTRNGQEYNRFLGEPGSLIAMSDGGVLDYQAYTLATPSGSTAFRLYRGGGAAFVLSGSAPGGPVSWISESFAASSQPVLKGAVLCCKALLVRNYPEVAFSSHSVRSQGDEIQMVILTYAAYGGDQVSSTGAILSGVISPTGYGEGYSAADRYRITGYPMDRGRSRVVPDPGLQPAPFFYQE